MRGFTKDRATEWIKDRILGFFAGRNILLVHYAGGDRTAWLEIARRTRGSSQLRPEPLEKENSPSFISMWICMRVLWKD